MSYTVYIKSVLSKREKPVSKCVEDRGRISQLGQTQDIKMGSCVFKCNVPYQWLAQQRVGPVSVYCGVGCNVLCLRHDISLWQHIGIITILPQIISKS